VTLARHIPTCMHISSTVMHNVRSRLTRARPAAQFCVSGIEALFKLDHAAVAKEFQNRLPVVTRFIGAKTTKHAVRARVQWPRLAPSCPNQNPDQPSHAQADSCWV
jgi:hypothetical protein